MFKTIVEKLEILKESVDSPILKFLLGLCCYSWRKGQTRGSGNAKKMTELKSHQGNPKTYFKKILKEIYVLYLDWRVTLQGCCQDQSIKNL